MEDFFNSNFFQEQFIEDLKETLHELTPGYHHGIRVESKVTGNVWISSTNNLTQRLQRLNYLTNHPEQWTGIWHELFDGTESDQFKIEEFPEISTFMLVEGCFQVSEEKRKFLRTLTRNYLIFRERKDDQNSKEAIKQFLKDLTGVTSISTLIEQLDQILDA